MVSDRQAALEAKMEQRQAALRAKQDERRNGRLQVAAAEREQPRPGFRKLGASSIKRSAKAPSDKTPLGRKAQLYQETQKASSVMREASKAGTKLTHVQKKRLGIVEAKYKKELQKRYEGGWQPYGQDLREFRAKFERENISFYPPGYVVTDTAAPAPAPKSTGKPSRRGRPKASTAPFKRVELTAAEKEWERVSQLVLFHTSTLEHMEWNDVGKLACLGTSWSAHFKREEDFLWKLVCGKVSRECALFVPRNWEWSAGYKRLFFDQLWPARGRWSDAPASHSFDVAVAVRFRPGHRSRDPLFLPLSQALKYQGKDSLQGRMDPEEFMDPTTGALMRDPVLLPSSGRIMDRTVLMHGYPKAKKKLVDPFDQTRINPKKLVAQPELKARIDKWRTKRQSDATLFVTADEIDAIVASSGDDLSPEVMQAMMEAQMLANAARASQEKADKRDKRAPLLEQLDNHEHALDHDEVGVVGTETGVDSLQVMAGGDAATALAQVAAEEEDEGGADAEETAEEGDGGSGQHEGGKRRQLQGRVLAMKPTKVVIHAAGQGIRHFSFNHVFDETAAQSNVYETCGRPAILSCVNGFNTCVMCYGQTGSGKTHTMFGPPGCLEGKGDVEMDQGIAQRLFVDVFDVIASPPEGTQTTVVVEYVQISGSHSTGEETRCLLSGSQVRIGPQGELLNAQRCVVQSMEEAIEVLRTGEANKRYAATNMNVRSSRAHTAMVVTVSHTRDTGGKGTSDATVSSARLFVVDLAGSERIKKSGAEGQRKVEAVGINSSLMVLGKCIRALVDHSQHVPFFESRLTTLLRSALGGNARTAAIMACRLDDEHSDETLQTLRFGERCSVITNTLTSNVKSLADALEGIDAALEASENTMASLEARGKGGTEMYARLRDKHAKLSQRRAEIAAA